MTIEEVSTARGEIRSGAAYCGVTGVVTIGGSGICYDDRWQGAFQPRTNGPRLHTLTTPGGWPYLYVMDWRSRITIEPGKRGGKPCIRGLRITVSDVLEYLASGMTEEQILQDFPDLTRDDIRASLAFAADRERKFVSIPPA